MGALTGFLFRLLAVTGLAASLAAPAFAQGSGAPADADNYWCAGNYATVSSSSETDKAAQCVAITFGNLPGFDVVSKTCAGAWVTHGLEDDDDGKCHVVFTYIDANGKVQTLSNDPYVGRCSLSPTFYAWGGSSCLPVVLANQDADKTCPYGNPIFPFTGVKRQPEPFPVSVGGVRLEIAFDQRATLPSSTGRVAVPLTGPTSFGPYWQSNLHKRLMPPGQGATSGIQVQVGEGRWVSYLAGPGGHYVSAIDPLDSVAASGSQWLRIDAHQGAEELYDASGNLLSIAFADGRRLSYGYTAGVLTSIQDQDDRTLSFGHDPATGLVNSVTGPDGVPIQIGYTGTTLTSLTWQDAYARKFLYTDARFPWLLTGIVDERHAVADGIRFATFTYDAGGRATDTQHFGGVEHYGIVYGAIAPQWQVDDVVDTDHSLITRTTHWQMPSALTMTFPSGALSTMTPVDVLGSPGLKTQTQPAGSGCTASSSSQAYDLVKGTLTSVDDFDNNRTCYAYEARNLQTVVVEGFPVSKGACPIDPGTYVPLKQGDPTYDPTHPERKTTTAWHPDWALKVREAEPLKLTTWVYNGQPDPYASDRTAPVYCATGAALLTDSKRPIAVLCTRYEQATADTTGAKGLAAAGTGSVRKWSYTYNADGRLATATSPSLHATSYAYYPSTSFPDGVSGHTKGDLLSATNAKNQAVTYTGYDKSGRALASTDANGVQTQATYWPRGWPHTITVTPPGGAARTTTYDYWPTGLLHVATLPDGVSLTYVYDDAQRLTDIADAAGNAVHYELDNDGRRTSEQVKDASGRLASAMTRVYDPLNRLQAVTGAAN